jgi:hypothetical protein
MESAMRALYTNGSPSATTTATPHIVTGQYLAKAHLSRRQRAKLAADLSTGVAMISPLTVKQAAAIAGVPVLDVTKARRRNGKPNGRLNGHGETLAEHLARSSPVERLEAARILGIEAVWDQMISPIVSEERAAVTP